MSSKLPYLGLSIRNYCSPARVGLCLIMEASLPSIITGFGVEIELTLAFHEDLLVEILEQRNLTRDHIVKDSPDDIRRRLVLSYVGPQMFYRDTRPGHRGWLLRIDPAESRKDWKDKRGVRASTIDTYRTYWSEPLYIVEGILRRSKNYTIDVESDPNSDSRASYKEWKVVNDQSLVPAGKAEMKAALEDRIGEEQLINWDNTGVELVTPIMYRLGNDIEFDEIKLYLEALQGNKDSNFGIFPSKYGGVHVHIGFADPLDRLLILQHLAFIMLQYEPLLVKLFPFHRNGSHIKNLRQGICRQDTKSNQDKVRMYERHKISQSEVKMDDLGCRIFSGHSFNDLSGMMQWDASEASEDYDSKGHLVNFINMSMVEMQHPGAKPTIEFRHHESTTDSNAIKMWVKLLLRICETAQRIARSEPEAEGQQQGSEQAHAAEKEIRKYKPRPQELEYIAPLNDFFELIGLKDDELLQARDQDLRAYWQSRFDQYANATEGFEPSPDLLGISDEPYVIHEGPDSDDDDFTISEYGQVSGRPVESDTEQQVPDSNIESGAETPPLRAENEAFRTFRDHQSASTDSPSTDSSAGDKHRRPPFVDDDDNDADNIL